ncbi:hypothetical protein DL89DRAFT_316899 [Linderina pennispora]|uniref:Uncharacterized protein n=1 Tax=Linderina pennispora TaxID=61395 RepID=A0A1Y1W8L2_9FUNG|nr:uncharacterized protein DL89DRAFT_316899 [Linderina pennispora]ORX69576.1 hypothetical protein DL89DRAFT_316899 [Linderina pennispora]
MPWQKRVVFFLSFLHCLYIFLHIPDSLIPLANHQFTAEEFLDIFSCSSSLTEEQRAMIKRGGLCSLFQIGQNHFRRVVPAALSFDLDQFELMMALYRLAQTGPAVSHGTKDGAGTTFHKLRENQNRTATTGNTKLRSFNSTTYR